MVEVYVQVHDRYMFNSHVPSWNAFVNKAFERLRYMFPTNLWKTQNKKGVESNVS